MRQAEKSDDSLSIQWVDKKEDKFVVKFDSIAVPIEMDQSFYLNILKHLGN